VDAFSFDPFGILSRRVPHVSTHRPDRREENRRLLGAEVEATDLPAVLPVDSSDAQPPAPPLPRAGR